VDDALKTKGIIYLNVETSLLFAPPYQNFWLRAWKRRMQNLMWTWCNGGSGDTLSKTARHWRCFVTFVLVRFTRTFSSLVRYIWNLC